MKLSLGTENNNQVKLAILLVTGVVAIGGLEVHSYLGVKASQVSAAPARKSEVTMSTGRSSRKLGNLRHALALRLEELARSERVEYGSQGRNIFSRESAPIPIEAPLIPARPSLVVSPEPAPEPPKPPTIDLKYLGYAQSKDATFSALLVHGDDIFMAKSGEIIFHRYKVGVIQPASVRVTDLSYDNTQTIAVTAN